MLATDPASGTTTVELVTALHSHLDTELTELTITDGSGNYHTLRTTPNHPFWDTSTQTWTPASALAPGDLLQTTNGLRATVAKRVSYETDAVMYNLTIRDLHTYYVTAGATPVLVHNDCDHSSDALDVATHALARSQDGSVDSIDHIIPGIPRTLHDYATYADSVMDREGVQLGYRSSDDSTAYWDDKKKAIIIASTKGENTMFVPREGYSYFANNFSEIG